MTGNKTKIFVFVINTSQMNNRSLCPGKYTIRDPYTHKCLKLSLKGTLYNRYVVPFILGDSSFLYLFSKEDQQKFILFLKKHYLLPAHYTYHPNIRNNKSTVTNSRTNEQKWREQSKGLVKKNVMDAINALKGYKQQQHPLQAVQSKWRQFGRNQQLSRLIDAAKVYDRKKKEQGGDQFSAKQRENTEETGTHSVTRKEDLIERLLEIEERIQGVPFTNEMKIIIINGYTQDTINELE